MATDESVITQIQPALVEIAPRVLLVDDDEIWSSSDCAT